MENFTGPKTAKIIGTLETLPLLHRGSQDEDGLSDSSDDSSASDRTSSSENVPLIKLQAELRKRKFEAEHISSDQFVSVDGRRNNGQHASRSGRSSN